MSRICEFCGKGYQNNNLVPRGIGDRVTKRTKTRKMANLRSKRFVIGGNTIKVTICSSCLKRVKKDTRELEKASVSVEASAATK